MPDTADDRPLPPVIRTTVVSTERLAPHLVRVVLTGPDLDRYPDSGFTDRYAKLIFPRPGVTYPADMGYVEIRSTLPPEQWPVYRTYTIRWSDAEAAQIAIDFVTHGGNGVAGPWAETAEPGDELIITPPGGAYRPSPEATGHLIVGDSAALPAIAAALEAMPDEATVTAIVQVDGPDDELALPSAAEIDLTWIHGTDPDALLNAVQALDLSEGRIQAFVHGELLAVRSIRKHLRTQAGIAADLLSLSGYWRRGKDEDGFQAEKHELQAQDRAAAG